MDQPTQTSKPLIGVGEDMGELFFFHVLWKGVAAATVKKSMHQSFNIKMDNGIS